MATPARFSPAARKLADADQASEVVLAVEPRAALGALGLEQSALLVGAEVLDPGATSSAATEMP